AATATAAAVAKDPADPGAARKLVRYILRGSIADWLMFGFSMIVIGGVFAGLAGLLWLHFIPLLIPRGFATVGWGSIFAAFGILYCAIGPFVSFALFPLFVALFDAMRTEREALRDQVASARNAQRTIEAQLEANDPSQLVPILGYSREML